MLPGDHGLPKPYLTREDTEERMELLGFRFRDSNLGFILDKDQAAKLVALEELIAGAITEWVGIEQPEEPDDWPDLVNELQEWAEEWLVG